MDIKFSAPAVVKSITGASLGGALIADGVINASNGPIIAGMVTIIGTAAVVVYGQFVAARNKGLAERRAVELKDRADERESLLKDYRDREKGYQETEKAQRAKIDVLQTQLLDAERRAARNYRDGDFTPKQPQQPAG